MNNWDNGRGNRYPNNHPPQRAPENNYVRGPTMPPPSGAAPPMPPPTGQPLRDLDGTMARPTDPFWMRRRYTREDSFPELRDPELMKFADLSEDFQVPEPPQPVPKHPKAHNHRKGYSGKPREQRWNAPVNANPAMGSKREQAHHPRRANDRNLRSDRTDFVEHKRKLDSNRWQNGNPEKQDSGFATAGMGDKTGYRSKMPGQPQGTFHSERLPVTSNHSSRAPQRSNHTKGPDFGVLMSKRYAESRSFNKAEVQNVRFNKPVPPAKNPSPPRKVAKNRPNNPPSRNRRKKQPQPAPPSNYNPANNWREPRSNGPRSSVMPQKPMKSFQPPAHFTPSFGPPPPKLKPSASGRFQQPRPSPSNSGAFHGTKPASGQTQQQGFSSQKYHGGQPAPPQKVHSRVKRGHRDRVPNGNDYVTL